MGAQTLNAYLYSFFWVIQRLLNFMCRHFGTLCLLHLDIKMEQTECFEEPAHKIQTPGDHPKEGIQYSQQGESL
jgi:hypothetical protein